MTQLATILTHPGSAHKDELLACSVLLALHPVPIVRREPTPADLASPHSSPANGVDWPVRVATSGMDGLRGALACAATGLPTHLRMRLFGRFPGDRGIQAAVAALGPIPLSPDEVAAL